MLCYANWGVDTGHLEAANAKVSTEDVQHFLQETVTHSEG